MTSTRFLIFSVAGGSGAAAAIGVGSDFGVVLAMATLSTGGAAAARRAAAWSRAPFAIISTAPRAIAPSAAKAPNRGWAAALAPKVTISRGNATRARLMKSRARMDLNKGNGFRSALPKRG